MNKETSASTVVGIALMAVASIALPLGDGIAKQLSATHSPLFISWVRYAVSCSIVLPVALLRFGTSPFPTTQIGAHVLRTLCIIAAMTLYFMAIARIPMATAISAFFVGPILAMGLAVVFLREPLTLRKMVSLGLGVVGTLLIVRPGKEALDTGLLLALGSGVLFGFYMIATRLASQQTDPIKTLAFQCAVGTVLLFPQAVWTWSTPAIDELWLFACLGALSAVCHIMSIAAFRYAQASTLAPIVYLELLGSVLIGYLAFGDVPGTLVWVGAGAIVAAGLILLQRRG